MKVVHISNTDNNGGAARAMYRIHQALSSSYNKNEIDSFLRVFNKRTKDPKVLCYRPTNEFFLTQAIHKRLNQYAFRKFKHGKPYSHTIAWPNTGLGNELNQSSFDLIHLHFLDNYTISIEEIGALNKPIVWTLHDMWAFCGAEHYVDDSNSDARFINGYIKYQEKYIFDLNRKTWLRKRKSWHTKMNIVCPSSWMEQCVRKSKLMYDWNTKIIPNPIDVDTWYPVDKEISRNALNLPNDKYILLFGAMGGTHDLRKGGDLLEAALLYLNSNSELINVNNTVLLIFGQNKQEKTFPFPFPTFYTGELNDDLSLRLTYSAADVMIIPSRKDNLPNTALESMACGTPVVSFEVGGLPDLIEHKQNGWMAKPFDTQDMAEGILWVLSDKERHTHLSTTARRLAEERYHPYLIASKYAELYNQILNG